MLAIHHFPQRISDRRRDHARHPWQSLDVASSILDGATSPEETAIAADDHRTLLALLARLNRTSATCSSCVWRG